MRNKSFIVACLLILLAMGMMMPPKAAAEAGSVDWTRMHPGIPPYKTPWPIFTLSLTEEQAACYAGAVMKIVLEEKADEFAFVFEANQNHLYYNEEERQLYGRFIGNALYAVDEEGCAVTEPLAYWTAEDGSLRIPADLAFSGSDGHAGETQHVLICAALTLDTGEILPGDVLLWDEDTQSWADHSENRFSDYAYILVHHESRFITYTPDGGIQPFTEWDLCNDRIWELRIGGNWSFRMLDIMNRRPELYAFFEVRDTENQVHASKMMVLGYAGVQ